MSFTYDTTTNVGKVRNLIDDKTQATAIFTDEEITAILGMCDNEVMAASGVCLLGIAASKARLAKKKQAGNYSEDLTAIARECRETAKTFMEMAQNVPADAVIEQFLTDFNYNEILRGKELREEDE